MQPEMVPARWDFGEVNAAVAQENLNPKVSTGRPRTFEPATRERIVAIALTPPTSLGEPLTHWSLRRLKSYLERRRVVGRIAIETLRSILREKHITFQRTRRAPC